MKGSIYLIIHPAQASHRCFPHSVAICANDFLRIVGVIEVYEIKISSDLRLYAPNMLPFECCEPIARVVYCCA